MVGLEFASPSSPGVKYDHAVPLHEVPPPEHLASRVAKRCIEKGMLLLTTSIYEVVRFIPPLNISKQDLAKGCAIFGEAVREVVKEGWQGNGEEESQLKMYFSYSCKTVNAVVPLLFFFQSPTRQLIMKFRLRWRFLRIEAGWHGASDPDLQTAK